MPEAAPGPADARTSRTRDPRLDVLRGLALVTIFVTHTPPNALEDWTLREWGFSDAAEGFVILAGVSAGLAYGPFFRRGGDARAGLARAWGRAWAIYLVHLLVTACALGMAAALALRGLPDALGLGGVGTVLDQPLEALVAIPLLLHQLDYADILPLYALLLLAAPLLLWAGARRPWALLAGSAALWAAAGTWRLNLPTWPEGGGWLLSPVSWQVLFVVGLLAGLAARDGRRLVPASPALVGAAAAVLLLAFAWRVVPAVGATGHGALGALREAGAPWVLAAFHKTWETGPRLVHALALAYLLGTLPAVARLCAAPAARPLALLGRHALPVFALLTILAFLVQGLKPVTNGLGDALLLGGGVLLMLLLAAAREALPRR